jgi:hypothetical protein
VSICCDGRGGPKANERQDYAVRLVGLGDCEGAVGGRDTRILMFCDRDGMYETRYGVGQCELLSEVLDECRRLKLLLSSFLHVPRGRFSWLWFNLILSYGKHGLHAT